MTVYDFVEGRIETFTRSDGVVHLLVPKPNCRICSKPVTGTFTVCWNCYHENPFRGCIIQRALAATIYVPKTRTFRQTQEIFALKDHGMHAAAYAEVLGEVMRRTDIDSNSFEGIVTVPATAPHPVECGAAALGRALSDLTKLPLLGALSWTREVRAQKSLGREERAANRMNALAWKGGPLPEKVLIADDIITTGQTLREASRALEAAGAKHALGVVAGRDADIGSLKFCGVVVERV